MLPPGANTEASPQNDTAWWALQNLREQVRHWESLLLHQRAHLADCIRQKDLFEKAALERLAVIEEGQKLIRERENRISQLAGQISALQKQLEANGEETMRLRDQHLRDRAELTRTSLEADRGMAELAQREKALTAQVLELQSEGPFDELPVYWALAR